MNLASALVLLLAVDVSNLLAQTPPVSFVPFEGLARDLKDVAVSNRTTRKTGSRNPRLLSKLRTDRWRLQRRYP